jgi:zinc protease
VETARQDAAAAVAEALAGLTVHERQLANGMRVLVCPRPTRGRLSCRLLYRVGSACERPGRTGISHLLEHLMFKGTERLDGREELWGLYLDAGGTGLNAFTGEDATVYTVTLPPSCLELFCWLEADRMQHAALRGLETERKIILEERRLERSRPQQRYAEALRALHYRGTPYRWPVTGYAEDIARTDLRALRSYYRTFYAPGRAVLALVGDVDPDVAMETVDRTFGAVPARGDAADDGERVAEADGPARMRARGRARSRVSILFRAPAFADPDAPCGDLAVAVLEGTHGRLHAALVEQSAVAAEASALFDAQVRGGVLAVEALPRPGAKLHEAELALRHEVARLAREPVPAAELERARRLLTAGLVAALEHDGRLAERLAWWTAFGGGVAALRALPERWAAVTPEALRAFAAHAFDPSRATVGVFEHAEVEPLEVRAEPPVAWEGDDDDLDLDLDHGHVHDHDHGHEEGPAEQGGAGAFHPRALIQPPPKLALPRLRDHEVRLLGGRLRCVIVPDRSIPVVRIDVFIRRGEVHVPRARRGLAMLAAHLLRTGGAGARDVVALDARLAELAAHLDADAGLEATHLELWALRPVAQEALGMFADMLLRPRFEPARLERAREELIEEARHRDLEPENALGVALRRMVYGDHPAVWQEDAETLRSITAGSLRAFHAELLRPEGMALAVSGDVDPDTFAQELEELLAPLADVPGVAPPPEIPAPVPAPVDRLLVLDHAGDETAFEWVAPAVERTHPDVVVLGALDQVLGGESFTSRIPARVRGEEGLAYGAGSYFVPRLEVPGVAGIYVQCAPGHAARAARICREEIARLSDGAPTEAELARARRVLRDGLAQRTATPRARSLCLAELCLAGAPPDHLERALEQLEALTPEDIRAACARYLATDRLHAAFVGPAAQLLASDPTTGDRLADLGEVEVRPAVERGETTC